MKKGQQLKKRVGFLFAIFLAGWATVVGRLVYIQIVPNPRLEKLERSLYQTVVMIPPQRGKIMDRNGSELATTVSSQSLFADPKMIESPKKLSKELAPILNMSVKDVLSKITGTKRFVWLKRHISPDAALEIESWKIKGLGFVEEGKRGYPNQELARSILGTVGREGDGLEGVEKSYDRELKGEEKRFRSRRDARGIPLVVNDQVFQPGVDGGTLVTTLDRDLQYELEIALEAVVREKQAVRAMGVMLDPQTSEILAMSTTDGNEAHRNRVVTDVFEPGSTFKIIMAASALRSGKILPNTKFNCENGFFKIGNRVIREADKKHSHQWLTLAEILEVSSNIGSAKVAFAVGENLFRSTLLDFGFMSKTGVDFPGEALGLWTKEKWSDHLLASVAFGHGIGVTALQVANAYAAIANGGKLMRPYLVREVRDNSGSVMKENKPAMIRQVLDSKESQLMTLMLTGTTEQGGTGGLARVDGYPVAGKTGTAQKADFEKGGYKKGAYLSSFAGFVPSTNPQFVIYILVDEPKKGYYGAEVAAPVFHRVASYALRKRGFMPVVVRPELTQASKKAEPLKNNGALREADLTSDLVPNFSGLTMREVANRLSQMSADGKLVGRGVAFWQDPKPGATWSSDKRIRIQFREVE